MSGFSKRDAKGVIDTYYIVGWRRAQHAPVSYYVAEGRHTNHWTHAFKYATQADAQRSADTMHGAWVEKITRERL